MLAISCLIEGSESNIMLFYRLNLKPSTNIAYFSDYGQLNAYVLGIHAFKVTKLLPIEESKLMFAVTESFGAYIINMTLIF